MSIPIPGPKPWPVLGNLLDIDTENSIQSFSKLCLEYGMKALYQMTVRTDEDCGQGLS